MAVRNRILFPMIFFTVIGIIADVDYVVYVNDSSTIIKRKCGDIRAPCKDIASALYNISNWNYTDRTAWIHIQKLDNCSSVNITDSLKDEKTHNSKVARRSIGFRGGNAIMTPTRSICRRQNWQMQWLQLDKCTSHFDLHLVDLVIMNGTFLEANCSQTRLNMTNVTVQEGVVSILNLMNNATMITNTTLKGHTGIAIEYGLVDISGLNVTDLDMMELVKLSDLSATSRLHNSWFNGRSHYGIYISGEVAGFAIETVQLLNLSKFEIVMNITSFAHPLEAYSDGLRLVSTNIEVNYIQIDLKNNGPITLQNLDVIANTGILSLEYQGAKLRTQRRGGGDGVISNITNCMFKGVGADKELLHINLTGYPSSKLENQLSVHNLTLVNTTMKMDLEGNQAYLGGLHYDLPEAGVNPFQLKVSLAKLMIWSSTIKACLLNGEVDVLSISGSNIAGDSKLSARDGKGLSVTLTDSKMDVNDLLRGTNLQIHKCVFPKEIDINANVLDISNSKFLEGGTLLGMQITDSNSTWMASEKGSLLIQPKNNVLNATASLKNIIVTNISVNLTGFYETRISGRLESSECAYFKPGNLSELDVLFYNISKGVRFENVTAIFGMGKIRVSNVKNLFFEGAVDLEAVAPVQRKFNLTSLKLKNSLIEESEALSENGTYQGKKLAGFILQNATNVTLQLWKYGKAPFEKKSAKYWGYIIAFLVFVIICAGGALSWRCSKGSGTDPMGSEYRLNTANAHKDGTIGPSR